MSLYFEKLFLKKRNIYALSGYKSIDQTQINDKFQFDYIEDKSVLKESQIRKINKDGLGYLNSKEVFNRLNNNSFILFLATEKQSGNIAGSYWAYVSQNYSSWFDSHFLYKNEVLLCNAFVRKKYRRRGIYHGLIQASHKYLLSEINPKIIYTIVEQSNTASNSVNRSFYGKAEYVNYLFKLISLNIFSVMKNKSVFRLYFVPLGKKLYEK